MKSYLYISAALATGLSILSGCGGSGSSEQVYLPVGLQRGINIDLPDGSPYDFSFTVQSASNAAIYTAASQRLPSTASIHVIGYVPADDTAEQIGFYWTSDGTAITGLHALVILNNVRNLSEGIGSATCSVRDGNFPQTKTQQDNCQAHIREFFYPGGNSES